MPERLRDRLRTTGAALGHLVARVRALVDATVSAEAPVETLAAAAASVDQAIAALAPFVPPGRRERYPYPGDLTPRPADLMPFDPVIGPMSPLAPPIEVVWGDGKAIGRACFGTPYEGPPGCVHGGVLAAAFDQVLNVANMMSGVAGPTARLVLRYRRPTPLHTEIVFESWLERSTGRRIVARGRCRHGEVVTVEAEGVFVPMSAERVMKLLERP